MRELTCVGCNCTATVENEDTLPSGWCEVNIPNEECDGLVGILCNDCKLSLLHVLIEHGAYPVACDFGNNCIPITDPSEPIICRFENKTLWTAASYFNYIRIFRIHML